MNSETDTEIHKDDCPARHGGICFCWKEAKLAILASLAPIQIFSLDPPDPTSGRKVASVPESSKCD